MCLAVPSKIVEINGDDAVIEMGGVRRQAGLMLVDNVKIGDYVVVHAGFAIHKIDEADAFEALRLLNEVACRMDPVEDRA